MLSMELMVEEAEEIKPPNKEARLPTLKVVEADKELATCNGPATVEEAEETNPPVKVESPVIFNNCEPTKLLEKVPNPADKPARVEVPVTDKVEPSAVPPPTLKLEEACSNPAICKELETVDEALEINPVFKLANPATLKVLEADKGPETFRDPE